MTDSTRRTAVIAVGGNALSPAGERATIQDQFRHTRESLGTVTELLRDGWDVCMVHGNGPQVGDELVRSYEARDTVEPLPLGVLVAGTAGWIGYMIQQSLENALRLAGIDRSVATVITQVVVDATDPALTHPQKFVGHALDDQRANELEQRGVAIAEDANGRRRRVVGSPTPVAIHEVAAVRTLLAAGTAVIACGGGGVPVYVDAQGRLEGVDCVVDKDLAAAVLATGLGADLFMVLTDVDAVYAEWGKATQRRLPRLSLAANAQLDAAGAIGEGSKATKVRAAPA
jgi:carbamate kinase